MTKKKSGTAVEKHNNTGFNGFAGVVNKEVPKVVTRPVYFLIGCFAGKGIEMAANKLLKLPAVPADGLKWKEGGFKDSWKHIVAPLISAGGGFTLAYFGHQAAVKPGADQTDRMLGEVGEFAGYGLGIYGIVSGLKKQFPQAAAKWYFPSLGNAEFDGTTGATDTPESKAEVEKSLAILKAAAQRDAGFKGTDIDEEPTEDEIQQKALLGMGWVEGIGWVANDGVGRLENVNWNNRFGHQNEALLSREQFKAAADGAFAGADDDEDLI